MSDKLKAKTVYNKCSKKWNIYVKVDDEAEEIPVGKSLDGLFFKLSVWDTEEEAIKWINEKLEHIGGLAK